MELWESLLVWLLTLHLLGEVLDHIRSLGGEAMRALPARSFLWWVARMREVAGVPPADEAMQDLNTWEWCEVDVQACSAVEVAVC